LSSEVQRMKKGDGEIGEAGTKNRLENHRVAFYLWDETDGKMEKIKIICFLGFFIIFPLKWCTIFAKAT
jgi:hypothetical protein